jgi:small-conductance mechanosensitive channel
MAKKSISIGDAVSFGWDTMKNNISFFIIMIIILWVAAAIPSGLGSFSYRMSVGAAAGYGLVFGLISFVVGMFVNMAQIKVGLRFSKGETADFPDLYNEWPRFWDFLLGSILYALIVIGGLILLIIPGIYWAIKYQFYGYLIIDQGMGPMDAIKKSSELTDGVKWNLLVFWLALFGIYILGFLACCVGLLFAIPVIMVAVAYVYRTLLVATEARQAQPPAL